MNVVATLPPSQVILGFAQLLQGCNPASVPFHEWPEPWKSAGVRVAGANGRRQEVLRECLLQQCGSHTEEVVRSIFAIDLTAPADHFSGWEPPVPFHQNALPLFPTDTLPQWLRQFVEAEAEATQTPPDMAAMMALSVLSLALAKKLIVRPKPGWIEPVNVWTITTMEPANRKSAVVRDLMEPVVTFLRNETQQLAPAIREAEARRKILDGRCEYTIGRASKARNDEAEQLTAEAVQLTNEIAEVHVPASPKLWTDDCTPEMMGSLLAEHDGRMAIISAEGNIIELMAGRYSKGKPNLGIYLAGHAGDAYMVDRRGWPSEYVPHAAISIGITVQREVLRSLADKPIFRGCGLLARFLYSLPQSSLGYRKTDPAPVPPDVIETYRRNILSLLSMPFDTDEEGHKTAHVVSLDRDAQTLLRNFQERLEPQLAPYGELGSMNDWAGKLCGAVLRLAGLLHAASQDSYQGRPWEIPISAQTMRQALRMGEYLVLHARAAFSEMGADPLVERARFILGWLERRNLQTFTQRDLFLGIRSDPRFRRVELIRPVLDFLMEHGCLRMRETERSAPGRRPSPTFEVNPFLSNPTEGSSID